MATDSIHTAAFAQSRFRALIADDQPSAREAISRLLEDDDSIEIVSECADGKEALAAIAEYAPDMLFVDVQLPEVPGFQVVESSREIPAVVFMSALERYVFFRRWSAPNFVWRWSAAEYLCQPGRRRLRFRIRNHQNIWSGWLCVMAIVFSFRRSNSSIPLPQRQTMFKCTVDPRRTACDLL